MPSFPIPSAQSEQPQGLGAKFDTPAATKVRNSLFGLLNKKPLPSRLSSTSLNTLNAPRNNALNQPNQKDNAFSQIKQSLMSRVFGHNQSMASDRLQNTETLKNQSTLQEFVHESSVDDASLGESFQGSFGGESGSLRSLDSFGSSLDDRSIQELQNLDQTDSLVNYTITAASGQNYTIINTLTPDIIGQHGETLLQLGLLGDDASEEKSATQNQNRAVNRKRSIWQCSVSPFRIR